MSNSPSSPPQRPERTERFVQCLAESQNKLYGYIYSLLGDHARAADVLQESNLVLWRKNEEFKPDHAFLPWALAIARFQVLAHLRDHKRDRVLIDAELAEMISGEVEQQSAKWDEFQPALRQCLQTLTDTNRGLIRLRYFDGLPIAEVARVADRSVSSVKVALLRARRTLAKCVESRMATEAS